MNSMLKQKSGLGFRPKAPQVRRSAQSSPQVIGRSATVERQSQTPGPQSTVPNDPAKTSQPTPASISASEASTVRLPTTGSLTEGPAASAGASTAETSNTQTHRRVDGAGAGARRRTRGEAAPTHEGQKSTSVTLPTPTPAPAQRKVTPIPPPVLPGASTRSTAPPKESSSTRSSAASTALSTTAASTTAETPPSLPRKYAFRTMRNGVQAAKPPQAASVPAGESARNQPRASIETTGEGDIVTNKRRASGRKRSLEQAAPDEAVTRLRTRAAKAMATAAPTDEVAEAEIQADVDLRAFVDAQGKDGGGEPGEHSQAPKKKRRKRSVTPADAENRELDYRQVKMADLATDLKIGKKFEKHDEIKQREKRRRAEIRLARKLRLQGLQPNGGGASSHLGAPDANGTANSGATSSLAVAQTAARQQQQPVDLPATGPRFEVIDGQIVVNQRSLQVDRHALAAAAAGELEQVEEDEFSRLTTSASYSRRPRGANHWTAADTERFYRALRMFGTNFQMITDMFPGRSRRQVKLKFNREERACPARVNRALIGESEPGGDGGGPDGDGAAGGDDGADDDDSAPLPIDLDEWRRRSGRDLESVEDIHAELRLLDEQHEAAQRRADEVATEIAAQKRAELYRGREDADRATAAEGGGAGAGADAGGDVDGTVATAASAGGRGKTRRKRGPRKRASEVDTGFGI